jgi:hypothetical protein
MNKLSSARRVKMRCKADGLMGAISACTAGATSAASSSAATMASTKAKK